MKPEIIKLNNIDSTNRYALNHFAKLADNTLVTADSQTAGRGRRGKTWISPPGLNLYATYIAKKPSFPPGRVLWVAGLATLASLLEIAPDLDVWLKWPNDICCSSNDGESFKKIAGLLAETWTPPASNTIEGVVAGIGVNLNMPPSILQAIDQPATSLFAEVGRKVKPAKFAEKLHNNLIKLRCTATDEPEKFFQAWSTANGLTGKTITIKNGEESTFTGIVQGVSSDGSIEIQNTDGLVKTFITGDIVKSLESVYNR